MVFDGYYYTCPDDLTYNGSWFSAYEGSRYSYKYCVVNGYLPPDNSGGNFIYYGLPFESNTTDNDSDGLTDAQELWFLSNMTNNETDGDGILDFDEVKGTWGFYSDPSKYDSNGNGVNDGNERIKAIIDQINQDNITTHVKKLSGDPSVENIYSGLPAKTRLAGTNGSNRAADYIAEKFYNISKLPGSRLVAAGNSAYTDFNQSFTVTYATGYPHGTNTNIRNIVTRINGTNQSCTDIYVIGAHYDSINYEGWMGWENKYSNGTSPENVSAPGANDNAGGVAALLEMSRVTATKNFSATIIFVAFVGEEVQGRIPDFENGSEDKPYLGSRCFIHKLSSDFGINLNNIKVMVNMDMILHNGNGTNPTYVNGDGIWYDNRPGMKYVRYNTGNNLGYNFSKILMATTNSKIPYEYITLPDGTIIEVAGSPQYNSSYFLGEGLLDRVYLYPADTVVYESDYKPFWDNGIPAVGVNDMITNENLFNPISIYNPKHSTNDTLSFSNEFGSRDIAIGVKTAKVCLGAVLIEAGIRL
jgi:hypothetical protein